MILINYTDKKPTGAEINAAFESYDGILDEGDHWVLANNLDGDNVTYNYDNNGFYFDSTGIEL